MALQTIIEQFILSGLFGGQGSLLPKKNISRQGLMILSGFLVAVGAIFVAAGLFLWLQTQYATYVAASLTGLLLVLSGTVIFFAHQAFLYYKLRKIAQYGQKFGDSALNLLEDLSQEFENPIQNSPKTAALLAGLAGYIAAEKIIN